MRRPKKVRSCVKHIIMIEQKASLIDRTHTYDCEIREWQISEASK